MEIALTDTHWVLRERRGLCLLARAAVAAGDIERGREALRTLVAEPHMLATDALKAAHCGAAAEVALNDGDVARALQMLRQAVRHWIEAGMRVCEVEARLRLAECLLHDQDVSGAELELHALESSFGSLLLAHQTRLEQLRMALREARLPQRSQ